MDFRIIKSFYSDVQANIYFLRLREAGINCFLSHENISTILPLSNGGVSLSISTEQIEEGMKLISFIEKEQLDNKSSEDFRDATHEDIRFAKEVNEYENWLKSGWIDKDFVINFLFILFVIIILIIIVNFFSPFFK